MSRHAVKLLGPPSLWLVVADYSAVQPAVQPLLDSGKIKSIVHGNSLSDFEAAMKTLAPPEQLIFAMSSPKAPEVLRPLLESPEKKKSLVWVHSLFTGVDAFQLQKFPQELFDGGIQISNAHGVFSHILAEHVMYASLYFLRRTARLQKNQNSRIWEQTTNPVLKDQKWGIIGYGDIAKECAAMAKRGFLVHDIQGWRRSGKGEKDDLGVMVVGGRDGFEDTIRRSDIILNVLPKTEETYHMVNKEVFAMMKPNTIFINIGRGTTVCEKDLADALNNNQLAGAALDVFEQEPLSSTSPLYEVADMDSKLLLTPHDADIAINRYFPAAQHFAQYAETFLESKGSLDHVTHWINPTRGY